MGQQSQTQQGRGSVGFPLDDLSYDLITILHEKSQALEAYEKYMRDAEGKPAVAQLLEQIRRNDTQAIEQLKSHVARALGGEQPATGQGAGSVAGTRTTGDRNPSGAV